MAHILIAEDEIGQAYLLERLCQIWGHTTKVAAHGDEALDLLHGEAFDLLLLDARMPFLDGITLAYILRRGRTHPNLPIIGMTAMAHEELNLFQQAGVDTVVEKPYEHETLRRAIDNLLASERQHAS